MEVLEGNGKQEDFGRTRMRLKRVGGKFNLPLAREKERCNITELVLSGHYL